MIIWLLGLAAVAVMAMSPDNSNVFALSGTAAMVAALYFAMRAMKG